MKKLFLTFAAIFAAIISLQAQTVKGSFAALKDLPRVRMVMDFSEADIHGMSEEEFAAAEALFEGLTRIIFSAANRIYQSDFDGKVFTFTLLLSEEEGSIFMRVEHAA